MTWRHTVGEDIFPDSYRESTVPTTLLIRWIIYTSSLFNGLCIHELFAIDNTDTKNQGNE